MNKVHVPLEDFASRNLPHQLVGKIFYEHAPPRKNISPFRLFSIFSESGELIKILMFKKECIKVPIFSEKVDEDV